MAMVTEKLLEDGRPSRNRVAIPIMGIFVFILCLAAFLSYGLAKYYQPLIDLVSQYKLNIEFTDTWAYTWTIDQFIAAGGWAILGVPGGLLAFILVLWMKKRKKGYTPLLVFLVLAGIVAVATGAFKYIFLHFFPTIFGDNTPSVHNICRLIILISEITFYGFGLLIGIFSWFDPLIHGRFSPIYSRRRFMLKSLKGAEKRSFRKSFRKMWNNRDYDAMVRLLYEDHAVVGMNQAMDPDTYRRMRENIIDSYGRAKGDELDYLYFSGQFDALRADQQAIQAALEAGRQSAPAPVKTVKAVDSKGRVVEVPLVVVGEDEPVSPEVAKAIQRGKKRQAREK